MEPDVHQVLLWLHQENPWLYIVYTLQRVIIFGGGRVNSNFGGKIHQIQLIKGCVCNIFASLFFKSKREPLRN